MRVEILGSGHRDIVNGSRFYDEQQRGLGITLPAMCIPNLNRSLCMRAFMFDTPVISRWF